MPNSVLVGLQWGDEGKGKIIDVLTESADIVVRMQGGNNAGHTVIVNGHKYVLHLIPSGILHKDKLCVIGNGVVLDPLGLVQELDELKQAGVRVGSNLMISDTAHLVLAYHKALDGLGEDRKGNTKIGTTRRGIGPAYMDKASRRSLRVLDLMDPDRFARKLKEKLTETNQYIRFLGGKPVSFSKTCEEALQAGRRIKPFVRSTPTILNQAIKDKKGILFEGAQGSFLDIDHGTYPFVTSSNTTSGGACTGSGVAPNRMDTVIGVMKAYTTRVGEGPFPSEDNFLSDYLHNMGREYGATTGRARRCGWFDAVACRQSVMINGVDRIAVTNLDGLDEMDEIKVCVAYKIGRKEIVDFPADAEVLAKCMPIYKTLPGWRSSTETIRTWKDIPAQAKHYLSFLSESLQAKIGIVSVGPGREQTLILKRPI